MGEVVHLSHRTARNPESDEGLSSTRSKRPETSELLSIFECAYDERMLFADCITIGTDEHVFERIEKRIAEMEKCFFDGIAMGAYVRGVKIQRNTMSSTPMEVLVIPILTSTSEEWREKPIYFCTLTIEYRLRMHHIRLLGTNRDSLM